MLEISTYYVVSCEVMRAKMSKSTFHALKINSNFGLRCLIWSPTVSTADSTLSSILNSGSTIVWNDLLKRVPGFRRVHGVGEIMISRALGESPRCILFSISCARHLWSLYLRSGVVRRRWHRTLVPLQELRRDHSLYGARALTLTKVPAYRQSVALLQCSSTNTSRRRTNTSPSISRMTYRACVHLAYDRWPWRSRVRAAWALLPCSCWARAFRSATGSCVLFSTFSVSKLWSTRTPVQY